MAIMLLLTLTRMCPRSEHVFSAYMRHHFCRLGSCEERNNGSIWVEAKIAIIGHYMDGGIPRDSRIGRRSTRARIIHCADIDSCKSDPGKCLKYLAPV
jgi:hypothetical protein